MLAATTVPAIGLIVLGTAISGTYDEIPLKIAQPGVLILVLWIGQHLVWAAFQQGLLQLFLRPVIGESLRTPAAATLVTAMVFGLLHLPCPILVASTIVLGVMWVWLFRRHGRIAPVIVSHAMLAALAFVVVPPQWNCELLVGVVAQRQQPRYQALRSPETRAMLKKVTSDEYFRSSGATDEGFIKSLYRDMLGRRPAEAEVQHWIDLIGEGFSRNRIAVEFAGSVEFRMAGIERSNAG